MPTNLILRGGGEVSDPADYADDAVETLDKARSHGEGWLWLDRYLPSDAIYSPRSKEPVAIRVADVVAVSGLRRSDIEKAKTTEPA